jgi:hypothetical protein
MLFQVAVTLPDGHSWVGELDIDDADLEVGEPGEEEIDLEDEEVQAHIHHTVAEWLLYEQIDWRWSARDTPAGEGRDG